jgi:hypothetical protein
MFKSFFNKKTNDENLNVSVIGTEKDFPILMDSIASSYSYLDALCSIKEGLSYERIGTTISNNFPQLIDKYEFSFNGRRLCSLFVYAYHTDCVNSIPLAFKELNPNADNSIFKKKQTNKIEKEIDPRLVQFRIAIDFIILKNGFINDDDISWDQAKQNTLTDLLKELGYEENFETLIVAEWNLYHKNTDSNKQGFITEFTNNFHNRKLATYTPAFIQDRNRKIEEAYSSIIETINRIQAWLNNEPLRVRIEIDLTNDSISTIKQCATPFCVIYLVCDSIGRYSIAYALESRILDMLTNDMASTLIRRIYEFTPGELEGFVDIISLKADCIKLFEDNLERAEQDKNFKIIKVERNKEESISDMLSELELKDDIDEETKKWFNK